MTKLYRGGIHTSGTYTSGIYTSGIHNQLLKLPFIVRRVMSRILKIFSIYMLRKWTRMRVCMRVCVHAYLHLYRLNVRKVERNLAWETAKLVD